MPFRSFGHPPVMHLFSDSFGQDILVASPQSVQIWDATMMAFLSHGAATPEHLGRLLSDEPDMAMAHAIKGMFYLLLGRPEMVPVAAEARDAARSALKHRPNNLRETCFVDALEQWLAGSPRSAIAAMGRILAANPQDIVATKIDHAIRFVLGDARGMRRALEAVLPTYDAAHPGRGYLLGCHAFALEETGDYAKAETAGRMGLALSPDDAWGLHAVAHVFEMTGDSKAGINWLTGREAAWAHCNNFRYHVWWHKSLMHLDMGQIDVVLDLYDHEIRRDKTDDYRDISNAASLLTRLELDGVNVSNRWDELADISESRTADGCLIFADLHYLMALTSTGRDGAVTSLMQTMRKTAAQGLSEMAAVAAHPGIAAGAGLEAFGAGDYRAAYLNMAKARRAMPNIGGSHAQRDVFERLTIDAAIRAGFLDDAQTMLAERTGLRAGHTDRYSDTRLEMIARASSPDQRSLAL